MSIDRNTANANSTTAFNAIQTAADTYWIANVDSQIATAITLGQFTITAMADTSVNLNTVFQYYANLGYNVSFPDFANQNGGFLPSIINQPANLFGSNWNQYWMGLLTLSLVQTPCRISIAWQ